MRKRGIAEMTIEEIIAITLIALFLIKFFLPLVMSVFSHRNIAESDIRQFKHLIADISSLPKNDAGFDIGFAINKETNYYQLLPKLACRNNQEPKKDNCNDNAELCLVHINNEKKPVCMQLESINFKSNSPVNPKGTTIHVKKHYDNTVEFS